ncbi:hypothetical protein [Pseudomonas viridiflava]|uniref:hypothetical protein n=1 Tax=Pseudomonas viridiflava TaxID=33069 RepID=UPI000F02A697|nr:hypothetical protein [Pseudomonas viridiflava]
MPAFAIIAEGVTDQIVLEKIIRLIYKSADSTAEISVTHLQPTRDATDDARQADGDFGGWQQVLEHCSSPTNLYEALALNDYIVIHIDSDICRNEQVAVDPNLPFDDLIVSIEDILFGVIDPAILADHRSKLILAVAVHSTECWLLPFFTNNAVERKKVNSCEEVLRTIAKREGINYAKDGPCYLDLVRDIRKVKQLLSAAACSPSLARFISSLPAVVH